MQPKDARCLLFTPGNKPERFEKAKEIGADGIIIDLEDAVSLADKKAARKIVLDYLKTYDKSDKNFIIAVRINSIKTQAGIHDLSAIIEQQIRPDVLVLPKVENANEITIINDILAPNTIPIYALIESAIGLYNADEIAKSKNVVALIFGGADLAADLGATMDWEAMSHARSVIVQAAASAGVSAMDVPYLNFHDETDDALIAEANRVKQMGYTGKLSIHPKHVIPIIKTFSPTPEEIEKAKQIVDIYESAKGNACEFNGKMIDVPVYKAAERILRLSQLGE